MLLRYAFLVTIGFVSLYALITAGATAGHMNFAFWMLAAMGVAGALSLFKFVFAGLPAIVGDWCRERKDWFYTFALGCVVCTVFYLF
jgi:formate hydrogenlyase subunit 3/multisubunit Na+/H+ antiporter MnhD subunit